MSTNEYNNNAVSAPACAYATLGQYNGCNGGNSPYVNNSGQCNYVVPDWGEIGYDALTGPGCPSCSGFFTMEQAYGRNSNNCNQRYLSKSCNR